MSNKVDVLAVLALPVYQELQDGDVIMDGDELLVFGKWTSQWEHIARNAVGLTWRSGMAVTRRRIDTTEARAAVAELIAADNELEAAESAWTAAVRRRCAALARCKGESP